MTCGILAHTVQLPLSFFEKQGTGYLMSRIREDVATLDGLMPDRLLLMATQVLRGLIILLLLIKMDPGLSLGGVTIVALLVGALGLLLRLLRRSSQRLRELEARTGAALHELLSAITVMRAAVAEKHELERTRKQYEKAAVARFTNELLSRGTTTVVSFLARTGIYLILALGAYRILLGVTSIGCLIGFFVLLNQFISAVEEICSLVPETQSGLVSLERIDTLLTEQPEEALPGPAPPPLMGCRGAIELRNVSFAYEADRPLVLDRINLAIRAGETLAVVGPSGAGKSTLASLLIRVREPVEGSVLLDRQPVTRLPRRWLRCQIGFVPQTAFLFQRTVRENIAFAVPDAPMAQIREAARAAYADQFIMELPQGYETPLGENGVSLSVGQRQRIAIARELLRDPAVLILDEATSNLDAESEALVGAEIRNIVSERTCIIIAHRLATTLHADRTIVLDRGRLVEQGTHAELLSRRGLYWRLYQLQALEQDSDLRSRVVQLAR
jgi:ABC-type multidrug transport system fused ATPase/permease subunit